MRPIALFVLAACATSSAAPPAPKPAPPAPSATAPKPAPPAPADTVPLAGGGNLTIQPIYHATVVLEAGGKTWITDPWSKGPLGDRKADVVLLTDIHPDHLDDAGLAAVHKEGTLVVGPKAVADKTHVDVVLANGESKDVAGVHVTAVPMYNLTRGPEAGKLYHDKGRGNGYLLDFGTGSAVTRVYIAGDTECTDEMKALENVDVAFLPMNLPYTMPPAEAAACAKAFHPKILYPYHYGTSDLSALDSALAGTGIEVRKRDWYPGGQPF